LERNLPEDSFLRRHKIDTLTSVFPSTTAAATTTLRSGLNPAEHGWTGWDTYIQAIDEIVTVFRNTRKDEAVEISNEYIAMKYLGYRSLTQRIHEEAGCRSYELFPFGSEPYHSLEEMNARLVNICKAEGRSFTHAYCTEPDSTLHDEGTQGSAVGPLMEKINASTESLISQLKDTLVICVADHGHVGVKPISLTENHPDIVSLLEKKNVSGEGRCCVFWVSDQNKDAFQKKFKAYFEKDFLLMTKQEVLDKKLYGDGIPHKNFEASLGDFIAIGTSNKFFKYKDDHVEMQSHHAGMTAAEMVVPLIVFET